MLFRSDKPVAREYIESGGDIKDFLAENAPLLLQRHYADKGLGRQTLELGGHFLTPSYDPAFTNSTLYQELLPQALEVLKQKKFANGGKVSTTKSNYKNTIEEMKYALMKGGH